MAIAHLQETLADMLIGFHIQGDQANLPTVLGKFSRQHHLPLGGYDQRVFILYGQGKAPANFLVALQSPAPGLRGFKNLAGYAPGSWNKVHCASGRLKKV